LSQGRSKRALIVPIFIPNQGCPQRCIFCHQEKITSRFAAPPKASDVKKILDTAINAPRFKKHDVHEIAFYGGTFTRLPPLLMKEILDCAAVYIKRGLFRTIRISTRPDALDSDRLRLLKDYGVSVIELGVQSMNDSVLTLCKRGYTAQDCIHAVRLLKQHDFRVGIQLMPGLPGDSRHYFKKTIEEIIRLKPDMVRLYPAIVIKGTELAALFEAGSYRPLSLSEAVEICEESCMRLEDHGIPVIRIGLMASPDLLKDGQIVAGPWHEALGFLVRSKIYQKKIEPHLPRSGENAGIRLRVNPNEIPLARGYKNEGIRRVASRTGARLVEVTGDESLGPGEIEVDEITF
jgi:histone acetyltransferase (RNA polymerase elongator complex component)